MSSVRAVAAGRTISSVRHAEDELVDVDRTVRNALGVRQGQTIMSRCHEILERSSVEDDREPLLRAARAIVGAPIDDSWRGLRRAVEILRGAA